jgi:predicted SnoaL-like aldol condensation-catalyzing enzyme
MAEGVELIQAFYDEMLGKGNIDKIDEFVTDDVVDHEQGMPGQPEGKEGVAFFVNR